MGSLPNRASDVPKEQRAKYRTMGVAIDSDFEPLYIVDADGEDKVDKKLKKKLKDADDELLLATNKTLEGEAIAWHLLRAAEAEGARGRFVFRSRPRHNAACAR